MVKVSIIIPVFNIEKHLSKAIESCLNQTMKEIEIILVNDGSTDNSKTIAESYSKLDNRVILINKNNEGVTIARNEGLQKASGKYVFFLDGDDFLTENAIELSYKCALSNDADLVFGDYILEHEDNKDSHIRIFRNFGIMDNLSFLQYCFSDNNFYYMGKLIRRSFLSSVNLNIPREITYGEDNVAIVQVGYNLRKALKIDVPVLHYVQRISSVTNKRKKNDLIQRANACYWVLQYAENTGFYDKIQLEIEIFMLKEICASIARGYLDNRFFSFLKLPFLTRKKYKEHLSVKCRLVLLLATINPRLIILLYKNMTSVIHKL